MRRLMILAAVALLGTGAMARAGEKSLSTKRTPRCGGVVVTSPTPPKLPERRGWCGGGGAGSVKPKPQPQPPKPPKPPRPPKPIGPCGP